MSELSLTIPNHDKPEYSMLPVEVRAEVQQWLRELKKIVSATHKKRAFQAAAQALQCSWYNVRTLYYDFVRCGHDWRVLVNRAKAKSGDAVGLSVEIVEIYRSYSEKFQRKSKPAWRKMMRDWRAGKLDTYEIKGCWVEIAWPEINPETSYPAGCTYENMQRIYKSSRFELAAMRDGLGSALAHYGPKLATTRVGLWVGSHYMFDDLLRDMEALWIGRNQKVRIKELGCLDVYSGDRFSVHRRPEFEEDGKKNTLKEREMRFMVANVLRNYGYSRRGTEMVTELGTAAIRAALQRFLHEHSGGDITVREAGITGREQAIAGYYGRGGGNPRHKAALESHHNLVHNEAAFLPAATGHDRNPPEWLHGLQAITRDVCKALLTLPRERAELLYAPMAEYWQLLGLLSEIDQLIAFRTDHRLEGWEKCGHTIMEFRRDPEREEWMALTDFLALPNHEQRLLTVAANADERYRRARFLAPREVFSKGMGDLVRFPDHVIALMFCDDALGEDLRKEKRLTNEGAFEITYGYVDPEPMKFSGTVNAPDGGRVALSDGKAYGVVLNPWDTEALWIYDAKGGFLGTAAREHRVSRLDEQGTVHALGERSHAIATLLAPLKERHANAAAEIAMITDHNARVIAGLPVTPEEKAVARETRKREAKRVTGMSSFLDDGGDEEPAAPKLSASDFL